MSISFRASAIGSITASIAARRPVRCECAGDRDLPAIDARCVARSLQRAAADALQSRLRDAPARARADRVALSDRGRVDIARSLSGNCDSAVQFRQFENARAPRVLEPRLQPVAFPAEAGAPWGDALSRTSPPVRAPRRS